MLERIIEEFGHRLGMDGIRLDEKGLLVLDIDKIGRLHLEVDDIYTQKNLFIYLSLPYPSHDDNMPRKVLEFCNFEQGHAFPIKGGVHKGWVLLLTELKVSSANAALIENIVRELSELLAKIVQD